ncbi:MAG: hypothetical protein ACRBN8_23750 [Nannocystales bacterium]
MSSSPPPRLSDDAQTMLAAYRDASPGARRRDANLEAVHQRVAAESPPRAAAAAGWMWPLGWGLGAAAAAAGLVWGLVELRSVDVEASAPAAEAPSVAAPREPARAVPQDATPHEPAPASDPEPAPPQPTAKSPTPAQLEAPGAAPVPPASDLREETRRLREVRASIASAAWDDAARQLAAYTHAFPNGALREDAQAYRIMVRCEQGRSVDALRRAFDARYPASPHAARMDAACLGEKKQ